MTEQLAQGIAGEQATVEYLRSKGFLIMERNWRCGQQEIDIIATRYGAIHFVEVKTRHIGSLTSPEQAIDARKCRALRRAASAYMAMRGIDAEPQFDLAAVDAMPDGSMRVRYIENAIEFGW
ncbi:MAG: YraN family protein [Alistipes sp.]|nr:YraN family protein [Alistipes sp.]